MGREHGSDDPQDGPPSVPPVVGRGWDGLEWKPFDRVDPKILPTNLKKGPQIIRLREGPESPIHASREQVRKDPGDLRERTAAKDRRLKVKVDGDHSEITLDDKTYPVKYDWALFLDVLIKARTWCPGSDMKENFYPHLNKPNRVRIYLMKHIPALDGLIESHHRGYRLKDELLE